MTKCPQCHLELQPDCVVCPRCSAVVSQAQAQPAAASDHASEPAARCRRPGCDGRLPPGSTTCPYCGEPAAVPAGGSSRTAGLLFPWGEHGVPWDGPLCIGRETSTGDLAAQIARFPNVSRRHAELGWHEGRLVVTDLSSTNGTFLNGQRLPAELPQPVADGDTVRFAASLSARVRIAGPA